MGADVLRPVEWVGSSKTDLKEFPAAVQDQVGFALYQAQVGLTHHDVKPLKGFGANVLEVVSRQEGDTYRDGVYGPVQGRHLCLACLSKEGQAGNRDPEAGTRARQTQTEGRPAAFCRHLWRKVVS